MQIKASKRARIPKSISKSQIKTRKRARIPKLTRRRREVKVFWTLQSVSCRFARCRAVCWRKRIIWAIVSGNPCVCVCCPW